MALNTLSSTAHVGVGVAVTEDDTVAALEELMNSEESDAASGVADLDLDALINGDD
jgi:hypothetical protein